MKRALFLVAALLLSVPSLRVEDDGNAVLLKSLGRPDAVVVPLWPDRVGPGETKPEFVDAVQKSPEGAMYFRPVVKSEMIIVPPPAGKPSTGLTVLVCPGGGYGALETMSITQCSKWLNEMGATTVMLKYRIPRRPGETPPWHLPLMDAQRALGLLRSRAEEWKLDPAKIGVIGFSAGGHLAAMASNHHAKRSYDPIDEHDRTSCRPDFCLLMYPAYLTNPILEPKPDPALELATMTPQRTPPTFITVVRPDKFTIGCLTYMDALRKAKVPSELHVFSSGGHGGCFDRYPLLGWGYESMRFLKDHGFLTADAAEVGRKWLQKQEVTVLADLASPPDSAGAARTAPKALASSSASTATTNSPTDALAAEQLDAGDAEVRKLLSPDHPVIPLWPTGTRADDPYVVANGAAELNKSVPSPTDILRIGNVSRPTLTVMRAAKPDGRAVIICPGGGYSILASEHEGVEVGRWLNDQGITVFLLKYRVPKRDGVPVALQDGQRAISLVRSRAAEFGVDPDWIGILGFSAGGHLAAECCHKFDVRSYEPVDGHDKAACRPNFGLLIYPGYLVDKEGNIPEEFAAPQRNRTPPLFVTFAANDRLVEGVFPYFEKLQKARVPAALHLYEAGGHGAGLRKRGYPFSQWTFAAERWLNDLVLMKP